MPRMLNLGLKLNLEAWKMGHNRMVHRIITRIRLVLVPGEHQNTDKGYSKLCEETRLQKPRMESSCFQYKGLLPNV